MTCPTTLPFICSRLRGEVAPSGSGVKVRFRPGLVRLLADECGAVTADWLALTASAVGVVLLGVSIVGQSVTGASAEIGAALSTMDLEVVTFEEAPPESGLINSPTSVESRGP